VSSAVQSRRSSEANGGAECAFDGVSSVGLRVASAAAEVDLHEREVIDRHHAVRRVHLERREQPAAERRYHVEKIRGRFELTEVAKERQVRLWISIAVGKRDIYVIHLNTT